MVKEITLPFTSETCNIISLVLQNVLMFSGIPTLIVSAYYEFFTINEIFNKLIALVFTIYGLIFTLVLLTVYGELVLDFFDEHKITFKCKCEKETSLT